MPSVNNGDSSFIGADSKASPVKCLAYVKYEGEDINHGVFDARDAANALLGIDKAVRYYVEREIPELRGVKYDFPVKIQEGSWEVLIPSNVDQLIKVFGISGIGVFAYTYLKATAEKAAKDGMLTTGVVKDIRNAFSSAVLMIQRVLAYVKHMGGFNKNPKVKFDEGSEIVTVYNKEGVPLSFQSRYLEIILKCPSSLLAEMVLPIRIKRSLRIGLYNANGELREESVNESEKELFCDEPQELDELPELKDGESVTLKGRIVRANEKEQSLGFQYNGHVITCKPAKGMTLASFKSGIISSRSGKLYQSDVEVSGDVERVAVDGRYKTKPRIFVNSVVPIDDISPVREQTEFDI